MTVLERLFDPRRAFDQPATAAFVVGTVLALLAASILVRVLRQTGHMGAETYRELLARTRSWYVLAAVTVVPILLGAAWVWLFFFVLSLLCYREFARVTGLSASRITTGSVVAAIVLTYLAAIDHWPGLFTTSWPLGICLIAVVGLAPDQPQGYLHRVALGVVAYALFGISLGHLAFVANDPLFRPILLWILVATELNDIFAYLTGKAFGRRKLLPHTSPNKTRGGAIGAVLLTTLFTLAVGRWVFADTALDDWPHLLMLGLIVSVLGQLGDLVLSSIKRDLNIKDMAATIPGHGGLLDRFDSLLIVAPVVFHYLNYFLATGIGGDQPTRILSS